MTNVTEMPSLNAVDPLNKEAEDRKARARELFTKIQANSAFQSKSSLEIGYCAFRLKEEGLFGILGFAKEDEARDAAGVGKSTWYSTIRLAEQFKELPEELFCSMKLSNAVALADLPDSKRVDRDWVKAAADKSIKEFEELIEEEMTGKAKASDTKERSVKLVIEMPSSQKKVLEQSMASFAETHGIEPTDTGKILEVAMAETNGGDTLTAAILRVVGRAKEIKTLIESGLSADEVLAKVVVLNEDTILDCSNALQIRGEEEAA